MLPIDHPRFRPAMKLIDSAQFAEAIQQLDTLLDHLSHEDRAGALYWKVICLTRLGEVGQARTCLEEALMQVDIRNSLRICLQLQSAFLHADEEGPEKAVAEIRSLLSRYTKQFNTPDFFWQYVDAKTYLGICLSRAGHYSEAISELEQALSLEPRPAARYSTRRWLSYSYHRSGDLSKARDHLERALNDAQSVPKAQLPPDYPALVRYELALIAYKQQRFSDAEVQLGLASAAAQNPELIRVITQLRSLLDRAHPA